jgi:hypothetical protein
MLYAYRIGHRGSMPYCRIAVFPYCRMPYAVQYMPFSLLQATLRCMLYAVCMCVCMYAVCCTLYAIRCTLYAARCTLYVCMYVCCMLHAVCCTLCAVCCMLYAARCTVRTVALLATGLCLYAYMPICIMQKHRHGLCHMHNAET